MTKLNTFSKLCLLSLAVGGIAASASSAQAANTAARLSNCEGSNRGATVQCCEAAVRDASAVWLRNHSSSCQQIVTCGWGAGQKRCRVLVRVFHRDENGSNDPRGNLDLHERPDPHDIPGAGGGGYPGLR